MDGRLIVTPRRPVGIGEEIEHVTGDGRIVQAARRTAEGAGRIVVVQSHLLDVVGRDPSVSVKSQVKAPIWIRATSGLMFTVAV